MVYKKIKDRIKKISFIFKLYKRLELMSFSKKWRMKNVHNETIVNNIFPLELVTVGKETYGPLNIFSFSPESGEQLSIGSYVSIAENVCFILGGNHSIKNYTTYPLYVKRFGKREKDVYSNGPITIEDEVWICTNATILSGVTIGKGAIIGAGAVVTKDVPPYSIIGGNPADIIKYRFSEDVIEILMPLNLNLLHKDEISNNIDIFYNQLNTKQDALKLKSDFENIISKRAEL